MKSLINKFIKLHSAINEIYLNNPSDLHLIEGTALENCQVNFNAVRYSPGTVNIRVNRTIKTIKKKKVLSVQETDSGIES